MPVQLFTNNAVSTLAADLAIGVTSMSVAVGEGALFPTLSGGDWFYVTLESGANREIVKVTARAGDVFTIVRAQEGTSDQSWTTGDTVELRVTNAWLSRVHTEDSLPAASIGDVNGPASSADNNVVLFNGTTGKILKDSGLTLSGSNTGDQVLSDATISTTDITTNNATTSKHGFMPKGDNNARHFYNGQLAQVSVPGLELFEPVVNGNMNLWQRGTTFTGVTTASMLADQYEIEFTTDVGVMDVVQVNPTASAIRTATGQTIPNALRVNVTTIDASIGVAEFVTLSQKIEGYRAAAFMHNEFTVSFFVRSNLTGQFAFAVGNSGDDRNYIKTFSPAAADTWERISITVPTQDATGTWNYLNGIGLNLRWTLVAGTDHDGTDDAWNSTADFSVAGNVNLLSSVSNYFELTGVQIDMGPDAKTYRGVPIEKDLIAAERYYQKSYDLTVNPGTSTVVGAPRVRSSATQLDFPIIFRTRMRAVPTGTVYSTTGASANVRDLTAGADRTATLNSLGESGMVVNASTSVSDGNVHAFQWTAEAKL